jgi:hypothetical protein
LISKCGVALNKEKSEKNNIKILFKQMYVDPGNGQKGDGENPCAW